MSCKVVPGGGVDLVSPPVPARAPGARFRDHLAGFTTSPRSLNYLPAITTLTNTVPFGGRAVTRINFTISPEQTIWLCLVFTEKIAIPARELVSPGKAAPVSVSPFYNSSEHHLSRIVTNMTVIHNCKERIVETVKRFQITKADHQTVGRHGEEFHHFHQMIWRRRFHQLFLRRPSPDD